MRPILAALAFSALAATAIPASAQYDGYAPRRAAPDVDVTGSLGRPAWDRPSPYDTDGDNDRHPELAPYQQGGGQQTGGPGRNLIPGDSLHVYPR